MPGAKPHSCAIIVIKGENGDRVNHARRHATRHYERDIDLQWTEVSGKNKAVWCCSSIRKESLKKMWLYNCVVTHGDIFIEENPLTDVPVERDCLESVGGSDG